MNDKDLIQSSDTDGEDCNRRTRRQMKRCCGSSFRSRPKRRASVDSDTCSDGGLSSILSIDKYIKYLGDKAERADESRSPSPPVLETNVNNDSQLTDEILKVNGESLSVPITDGLLNVAGVLQELPLPAPPSDGTGHHSLLTHLLYPEEKERLLKIRDSVIISKLIDSLCNTTTQHLEMVNESDREQSHNGKIPILLKTLLEEKPDIFKNSLHGLDQDNMKQFLMENEKSDSIPNNRRELSDNLHQISSKEQKSMNILPHRRKRDIECSSLISFQNNSNESSSFTPQVSNSSSVIVESSVPVVTPTKMSVVEQCQSVLNKKPLENSQSKIYEEESVHMMHNSLPNTTMSGSQTNKKTENFNQLANKQNNFHEKRASLKKNSDEFSIFYLEDQTVSETSVKQILMGKEKSCSQDYELSDNRNKSLEESYSEIYKEVNPNSIPDLTVQGPNGFKTITELRMKTNNTDIGVKPPPISYHPVVVLPNLSLKDINIAEKSVEQFTMRNRKTAYFPENTDIGVKPPPISYHPVVVLPRLSVKDINIAEKSVEQFTMRNRKTASFPENTYIGVKPPSISYHPVVVLPKLSVKDINIAEKSVEQFTMRNRKTGSFPEELYKQSNYQNFPGKLSRQHFLFNSCLNNSNEVSKSSRSSSNLNLIKGSISPLSPSIHNHLNKCAPSIALLNNSNGGSISSTSSSTLKLRRSPHIVSFLTNFSDKSSQTSILNNSSEKSISSMSSSNPNENNSKERSISPLSPSIHNHINKCAPSIALLNNSNGVSLSSTSSSTLKLRRSPHIVSFLTNFSDKSSQTSILNNSSEKSISSTSSSNPNEKSSRSSCTLNNSKERSISSPSSNIPKRLRVKFSAQIYEDTESDQNCIISSNSEDEKIDESYREVNQTKQVTQSMPRKEVKNKTSEKKLTSKILAVADTIKASNIYQHVYRVVDDSEEDIDFSSEIGEDIESYQNCTKSSHSEDEKIYESQIEVSESEQVTLSIEKKELKNKTSQTKLTGELLAVEGLLASNNYKNIYRIVDDSMEDSDFSTEIDEDTESDQSCTKSSNSEDENSSNLTEK